jgi:hypothetical protein
MFRIHLSLPKRLAQEVFMKYNNNIPADLFLVVRLLEIYPDEKAIHALLLDAEMLVKDRDDCVVLLNKQQIKYVCHGKADLLGEGSGEDFCYVLSMQMVDSNSVPEDLLKFIRAVPSSLSADNVVMRRK